MDILISELVNSTAQLAPKDFEAFIHAVYHQRAKQRAPSLLAEEEELLNKIYHKLPQGIQRRFEQLNDKMSSDTLTKEEYSEYLGLIELKENHNAECILNIVKLAQIKGVQPKDLMQQLGIFPLSKP
jgi:UDP-N-acetylmuramoylalanine-D-glutamate ligase